MSRELDKAIARLLGYEVDWEYTRVAGEYGHKSFLAGVWGVYKDGKRIGEIPHYSTDGNYMLELDREMREREWMLLLNLSRSNRKDFVAIYQADGERTAHGIAETIPEAVALAAYHALTGKEWTQ